MTFASPTLPEEYEKLKKFVVALYDTPAGKKDAAQLEYPFVE
jgi:hypothetical protein